MNKIRDIFKSTNLDKISNNFFDNSQPVCWYPSSGYDFRHIFLWDSLRKEKYVKFPKIFIHTDFTCLDQNPYPIEYMDLATRMITEQTKKAGLPGPHPLLHKGYILDTFGGENMLVIKESIELHLKDDVFYPNKELFYFGDQIGVRTHKVYAIICQLINIEQDFHSLLPGDPITTLDGQEKEVVELDKRNLKILTKEADHKIPYNFINYKNSENEILILLFTMENSNFFYDICIKNNLSINYLTHINDGGGSFGGSKTKMDFIYLYCDTIGLTNIIIDLSLKEKIPKIYNWIHHDYFNPKVDRQSTISKRPEVNIDQWKEEEIFFPISKGIYIKGKWDTGNSHWKYSYFKNEPIKDLNNRDRSFRLYEQLYYYERK